MPRTTTPEEKLKELIVYISKKCSGDTYYGVTKLNKILYFADSFYYMQHGKTISGKQYVHKDHGPVVQNMYKLMQEMDRKDIAISLAQVGPQTQKKPVALREADISHFEPQMISMLDEVIEHFCNKNKFRAAWLSRATHEHMGWRVTGEDEIIPINTFFLKPKAKQKFNSWEKQRAMEINKLLAGQYGLSPS